MDDLLDKVKELFPDNGKEPLLRIRVELSNPYNQNTIMRDFIAKYSSKVANPGEVLLFSKKQNKRSKFKIGDALEDSAIAEFVDPCVAEDSIIDLFRDIAINQDLRILGSETLSLVLEEFVVKEEPRTIDSNAASIIEQAKKIYKCQTESRPDIDFEKVEFHLIKKELETISDLSATGEFSDDYRSGEDTKDLIDITAFSPQSPTSTMGSRTPVTSPQVRGSARVKMNPRGQGVKRVLSGGKPRKRTRVDLSESFDGSSFQNKASLKNSERR